MVGAGVGEWMMTCKKGEVVRSSETSVSLKITCIQSNGCDFWNEEGCNQRDIKLLWEMVVQDVTLGKG